VQATNAEDAAAIPSAAVPLFPRLGRAFAMEIVIRSLAEATTAGYTSRMLGSARPGLLSLGVVALVLAAIGCEPVPAPYWGKLAHPTMTPQEISHGLDGHVRAVSEGANGGLVGGGGGCGCN
jgi:hypothetical protein